MRKEDAIDSELENALRALQPQAIHLDPADAAFAAGQRTGRRQLRLWQSAAALLLLAAVGPWLLPRPSVPSPNPQPVAQVPTAPSPRRPSTNEPLSQLSLLRLQQAIDKQGLAGLPTTQIPLATPLRIDGL